MGSPQASIRKGLCITKSVRGEGVDKVPTTLDELHGAEKLKAADIIPLYMNLEDLTNNWEISKGEVASGKAAMYFLGNWVIPQVIGAGRLRRISASSAPV